MAGGRHQSSHQVEEQVVGVSEGVFDVVAEDDEDPEIGEEVTYPTVEEDRRHHRQQHVLLREEGGAVAGSAHLGANLIDTERLTSDDLTRDGSVGEKKTLIKSEDVGVSGLDKEEDRRRDDDQRPIDHRRPLAWIEITDRKQVPAPSPRTAIMMPMDGPDYEFEDLRRRLHDIAELDPADVADPAAGLAEELTEALDALEESAD